jgi:hypothetical protein
MRQRTMRRLMTMRRGRRRGRTRTRRVRTTTRRRTIAVAVKAAAVRAAAVDRLAEYAYTAQRLRARRNVTRTRMSRVEARLGE